MDNIRKYRILGMAYVDWIATFLVAFIIQHQFPDLIYKTLHFRSPLQFYAFLPFFSVLVHVLTGQDTALVRDVKNTAEWTWAKTFLLTSIIIVALC